MTSIPRLRVNAEYKDSQVMKKTTIFVQNACSNSTYPKYTYFISQHQMSNKRDTDLLERVSFFLDGIITRRGDPRRMSTGKPLMDYHQRGITYYPTHILLPLKAVNILKGIENFDRFIIYQFF